MGVDNKNCLDKKIERYFELFLKINNNPNLSNESINKRLNQFICESDLGCIYTGKVNLNQYECLQKVNIRDYDIINNYDSFQEVFLKSRVISCMDCDNTNGSKGKSELNKYLIILEDNDKNKNY